MSATLAKIGAGGGYTNYLLGKTQKLGFNDHSPSAYYLSPGTPPGTWLGKDLPSLGLTPGARASEQQMRDLFDRLKNPVTHKSLVKNNRILSGDHASVAKRETVAGYDLTLQAPKSVSLLWALGDEQTRKTVKRIFDESVQEVLDEYEKEAGYTRLGKAGVARVKVEGVSAAKFDHWTNRDNEPHLHSHITISNFVRTPTGKIGTLDGRLTYANTVQLSKLHNMILMNKLHEQLGINFEPRKVGPGETSSVFVQDIVGMPTELITLFSQRTADTNQALRELVKQAEANGETLSYQKMARLRRQAWTQTRKPKTHDPESLHVLLTRFKQQAVDNGFNPEEIISSLMNPDPHSVNPLMVENSASLMNALRSLVFRELADESAHPETLDYEQDATADTVLSRLAWQAQQHRTSISRANVKSAVEDMASLIRFTGPTRDWNQLLNTLTDQVCEQLVPLNEHRYEIPDSLKNNPALVNADGVSVFDSNQGDTKYVTRTLLNAEQEFKHTAVTDLRDGVTAEEKQKIRDLLDAYSESSPRPLGADQYAAAFHVLTDTRQVTGITGPAGTGKTTSLKAVLHVTDTIRGDGKVLGISTSARAAAELEASLEQPTNTVAAILSEQRTGAIRKHIEKLSYQLDRGLINPMMRSSARADLSRLTVELKRRTIPDHGIVIVDEASMISTLDLNELTQYAHARGTQVLCVGDPQQLGSPGVGGGALAWLEAHHHTAHLTRIYRFHDAHEARVTQDLRDGVKNPDGTYKAVSEYETLGRIRTADDVQEAAYTATLTDIEQGKTTLIIAATNETVADINRRFTTDLQAQGVVDADPARHVTLSDNVSYGVGDVICTRVVDRSKIVSDESFIRNGDLWTLTHVTMSGKGATAGPESVTLTRKEDPNAHISVPVDWLKENAEGGYASTIHRAQGMTVDVARLIIPLNTPLNRESLYVGMSRARALNEAWVQTPDLEATAGDMNPSLDITRWITYKREMFEKAGKREWVYESPNPDPTKYYVRADLMPTPMDLAKRSLNEMVRNEASPRMASEEKLAWEHEKHSLPTLTAERNYLIRQIAAPHIDEILTDQFDQKYVDTLHQSDAWDDLVTAWTRARAVDPETTQTILSTRVRSDVDIVTDEMKNALFDLKDPPDPARILAHKLEEVSANTTLGSRAWQYGYYVPLALENPTDDERALLTVLEQTDTMIKTTLARIVEKNAHHPAPWAGRLGNVPTKDSGEKRREWENLIADISVYRALNNEEKLQEPLGRLSSHATVTRRAWRNGLSARISAYRGQASRETSPGAPEWIQQLHQTITTRHAQTRTRRNLDWVNRTSPPSTPAEPMDRKTYERITRTNQKIWEYWQSLTPHSWVPEYLNQRHLNPQEAVYAPTGWSTTLTWAQQAGGLSLDDLKEAGLVTMSSIGQPIDIFRERLALPIKDERGKIVGFTARANPAETEDIPKYVNTPQTHVYRKASLLYGVAPETISHLKYGAQTIICEGAMDKHALDQAVGVLEDRYPLQTNMVVTAPCGTSLTDGQLNEIRDQQGGQIRYPVFCFDSDEAGQKALARAWTMLTQEERAHATSIHLPGQVKDPAELVEKEETLRLAGAVMSAQPVWKQLIDTAVSNVDLEWGVERAQALQRVEDTIVASLPLDQQREVSAYAAQQLAVTHAQNTQPDLPEPVISLPTPITQPQTPHSGAQAA